MIKFDFFKEFKDQKKRERERSESNRAGDLEFSDITLRTGSSVRPVMPFKRRNRKKEK